MVMVMVTLCLLLLLRLYFTKPSSSYVLSSITHFTVEAIATNSQTLGVRHAALRLLPLR